MWHVYLLVSVIKIVILDYLLLFLKSPAIRSHFYPKIYFRNSIITVKILVIFTVLVFEKTAFGGCIFEQNGGFKNDVLRQTRVFEKKTGSTFRKNKHYCFIYNFFTISYFFMYFFYIPLTYRGLNLFVFCAIS